MADVLTRKSGNGTLEPEGLRRLLDYDPESGRLSWRRREGESPLSNFNTRFAGAEAFTARNNHGYCHSKIFYKTYSAHRVAWAIHYGEWPDGQIDHINGDRADNRIANLRCVSQLENQRNRRLRGDNRNGCNGIRPSRWNSNWEAFIGCDSQLLHLGTFPTKDAAIAARKAAEEKLGYHPNHGKPAALARGEGV